MRQKFIKVKKEDGTISFQRSRYLTLVSTGPNEYGFKDTKGNFTEPSELELELFNESQTGIPITNGWITFIGVMTLINLIIQVILISKL